MDITGNFNTDEKWKKRYTQSEKKSTWQDDSMACIKTSLSEKKAKSRERSQPVRITKLFECSTKIKNCPTESVRKRLPERLNHLQRDNKPSEGKQDTLTAKYKPQTINARRKLILTISPKQHIQCNNKVTIAACEEEDKHIEQAGYNINNHRFSIAKSNLGRPINNTLRKQKSFINKPDALSYEPSDNETLPNKRKSFLLPPNSIRNKHLVTENKKEEMRVKKGKEELKDTQSKYLHTLKVQNSLERSNSLQRSSIDDSAAHLQDNANNNLRNNKLGECSDLENMREVDDDTFVKLQENGRIIQEECCVENGTDLDRPTVIVKPKSLTRKSISSKLQRVKKKDTDKTDIRVSNENTPLKKFSHTQNMFIRNNLGENNLLSSNKAAKIDLQEQKKKAEAIHTVNKDFKKLCIDEKDVKYMKSNLECLISKTEEELLNLKEMLRYINRILDNNVNDNSQNSDTMSNVLIQTPVNVSHKDDHKIESGKKNLLQETSSKEPSPKVIVGQNIQRSTDYETISVQEKETLAEGNCALVPSILSEEKSIVEDPGITKESEDKENTDMLNICPNKEEENNYDDIKRHSDTFNKLEPFCNKNDSFLNLEDQLNIIHVQALPNSSCLVITPVKAKTTWREKSLHEYMMLKSSISFLQTPDAKRVQSRADKHDESAVSNTLKTCISHKVLRELRDLCADSPM